MYYLVLLVTAYFIEASEKKPKNQKPNLNPPKKPPRFLMGL